jgi:hypothetical protein
VLAVARAVDVEADGGHGEAIEDGGGDGGVAEVLATSPALTWACSRAGMHVKPWPCSSLARSRASARLTFRAEMSSAMRIQDLTERPRASPRDAGGPVKRIPVSCFRAAFRPAWLREISCANTLIGCFCSSSLASRQTPRRSRPPPPSRRPHRLAETAPEPTPEPAPAPGPDKAAITSILDEIDSHLAELAKGHKGSEHRDAIEKLVSQLEPLLAGFEPGTAPYAKLKENAKKFHDAQVKGGNSKDAIGHRTQVEDAVKELRSTL